MNEEKIVRAKKMTAAAIDTNVLNELFDNQKRLDDAFDSMFDDSAFLSSLSDDLSSSVLPKNNSNDTYSNNDWLVNTEDEPKSKSLAAIILPLVIEVAAIYYLASYFSNL